MNKRLKKYFIKYTLEFFVIVLGISFSFFVQNVIQEKEINSKRELIMMNLLEELKSNEAYLSKIKIDYRREMDYVVKLLKDSLTKEIIKEYPTNYSPFNPFLSALDFSPSNSIYNSLVNDGSFNLIKPPTLKALIDDVYKFNYNNVLKNIGLEREIAKEADRFFVNNYPEIYMKNFWYNIDDEKLTNDVFEIIKKDSHFKAFMVQKLSYMEVKFFALNNYSKKRDSLITLLKKK